MLSSPTIKNCVIPYGGGWAGDFLLFCRGAFHMRPSTCVLNFTKRKGKSLPYSKQSRHPIRRGIYVALPDKDPARISIVPAWRKNARLCGITKKSGSIFVK